MTRGFGVAGGRRLSLAVPRYRCGCGSWARGAGCKTFIPGTGNTKDRRKMPEEVIERTLSLCMEPVEVRISTSHITLKDTRGLQVLTEAGGLDPQHNTGKIIES